MTTTTRRHARHLQGVDVLVLAGAAAAAGWALRAPQWSGFAVAGALALVVLWPAHRSWLHLVVGTTTVALAVLLAYAPRPVPTLIAYAGAGRLAVLYEHAPMPNITRETTLELVDARAGWSLASASVTLLPHHRVRLQLAEDGRTALVELRDDRARRSRRLLWRDGWPHRSAWLDAAPPRLTADGRWLYTHDWAADFGVASLEQHRDGWLPLPKIVGLELGPARVHLTYLGGDRLAAVAESEGRLVGSWVYDLTTRTIVASTDLRAREWQLWGERIVPIRDSARLLMPLNRTPIALLDLDPATGEHRLIPGPDRPPALLAADTERGYFVDFTVQLDTGAIVEHPLPELIDAHTIASDGRQAYLTTADDQAFVHERATPGGPTRRWPAPRPVPYRGAIVAWLTLVTGALLAAARAAPAR